MTARERTLENDFVRLNFKIGTYNVRCLAAGLSWPPPERIIIDKETSQIRAALETDEIKYVMKRIRISDLTAEQADHPNIARGAEYRYEINLGEKELKLNGRK